MDMNHMINAESSSSSSSSSELLKAQAQVWNCAFSYINSMSLKCAVELGIPDVIHKHGQPMTLSQIASALDIQKNKAHCIQRLMRILVHSGFFAQKNKIDKDESEVYYSLTPASRLLLKDEPLRAAPFMFLITHPIITTPFNFLSSWFKNDDPSTPTVFESTHGKDFWGCLAQEAKFKNVFYDAMMTDSQFISSVLIKDCKEVFKGLKCLVDLGGGTGTMAKAIAEAFPEMKCIVFDLPHVVDNNLQQQQGTNKNLEFLGGDMFEAIPPADAVLLKWVLHDWGDEESVKILKKCKEAIDGSKDKGGKVIVIDMVIEDQSIDKDSTETQLCSDMLMMSLFSVAKERSIKEWKKLFLEAGFSHYNELKRLVAYARSSANLLTKLILEDQTDSCRWECLFRTPLNNYDAVVLLHRDRLPYPRRLLFPSEVNRGRHVARVNASKAFGPFLVPEEMKGSSEEVKNKMMVDFDPLRCFVGDVEKEYSKKLKLWYDSLGGDAIGLTWERVGSKKREREEAPEEETDSIGVLKAVGELGKGFVRDIYFLKAPRLMS